MSRGTFELPAKVPHIDEEVCRVGGVADSDNLRLRSAEDVFVFRVATPDTKRAKEIVRGA